VEENANWKLVAEVVCSVLIFEHIAVASAVMGF